MNHFHHIKSEIIGTVMSLSCFAFGTMANVEAVLRIASLLAGTAAGLATAYLAIQKARGKVPKRTEEGDE